MSGGRGLQGRVGRRRRQKHPLSKPPENTSKTTTDPPQTTATVQPPETRSNHQQKRPVVLLPWMATMERVGGWWREEEGGSGASAGWRSSFALHRVMCGGGGRGAEENDGGQNSRSLSRHLMRECRRWSRRHGDTCEKRTICAGLHHFTSGFLYASARIAVMSGHDTSSAELVKRMVSLCALTHVGTWTIWYLNIDKCVSIIPPEKMEREERRGGRHYSLRELEQDERWPPVSFDKNIQMPQKSRRQSE